MGKNNKINKNIKSIVVKQLSKDYKVSRQFVNLAIRKERDSALAEQIRKSFSKKYAALAAAIN